MGLLDRFFDEGVDQKGVGFRVDVFNGYLEAIESPSFWELDLIHEVLGEVLDHNAIASRKKGQDMGDEELLVAG
jgi:hypothetical protein